MSDLTVPVLFHLLPESGCEGLTVTVCVYRPSYEVWGRQFVISANCHGRRGFPALQVAADRAGFAVVAMRVDGVVEKIRHLEADWKAAWDALSLEARKFEGKKALDTLELIQARIARGGLKKVGQRGKSVKGDDGAREKELREHLEASILAGLHSGAPRLRAASEALEMPEALLPRHFRTQLVEIRSDKNGGSASMRELQKHAANTSREAEKAAKKADDA